MNPILKFEGTLGTGRKQAPKKKSNIWLLHQIGVIIFSQMKGDNDWIIGQWKPPLFLVLSLSSLSLSPHPHPTSMVNQQQRCAYYGCPCIFEKAGISYILLPVYLARKGMGLANNSVSYKTRIGSWSCLSAEERKLWKRAWLVKSGWPEDLARVYLP